MKISHSIIKTMKNPNRNLKDGTAMADRESGGIGKGVGEYQVIKFRRIKQSATSAHNLMSKRKHQIIKS